MDPQFGLASKDDLWRLQNEMKNVYATQAEHADRLMRLEQRSDSDTRLKSVWGTQSPFPSVLNGTPQQGMQTSISLQRCCSDFQFQITVTIPLQKHSKTLIKTSRVACLEVYIWTRKMNRGGVLLLEQTACASMRVLSTVISVKALGPLWSFFLYEPVVLLVVIQ